MTDKATADELDSAAQNAKRALRNLTNHLDARKCSIEDQVAEGQSLVGSIAACLKEQANIVQKSSTNARPSESVKTAAEDKVKKVRRQLDQNLDKDKDVDQDLEQDLDQDLYWTSPWTDCELSPTFIVCR